MTEMMYRKHAIERMAQRGVTTGEVRQVVDNGETIEEYPDDTPYPSRLVLGHVEGRPLHVVVAYDADDDRAIIITVYEPNPTLWSDDFRTRKES